MSLLEFLAARALLQGMALPDNYKMLRPRPESWLGLKVLLKGNNNVVAVEVTTDKEQRTQRAFLNLAREHDELTFIQAEIDDSGYTFPELRKDFGIEYTPTFVFAFFNNDGVEYAKFEGEAEIMLAIMTGRIDAIIKELMDRRRKLKIAEGIASITSQMTLVRLVSSPMVVVIGSADEVENDSTTSSTTNDAERSVCDLCKKSVPNPVTYHMRTAHPGCGKGAEGSGYSSRGEYSETGWRGDCGDGGRGQRMWYLMCKGCRAEYLARISPDKRLAIDDK